MRVLTWNLFHGRDFPPDSRLLTWRSRLLRITENDATHAQVNRSLLREFAQVLERAEWDVALLQEAPPRWYTRLRRELAADAAITLTSRNSLHRLRWLLADLNPDLVASNDGGSNQLLVRGPWRIAETREHTLATRPERRRMLWTKIENHAASVAVANVHGSVGSVPEAPAQILDAAAQAAEWAGELPLVFGGDLNLRPLHEPGVFAELEALFGLKPPTSPHAIDHLLSRGMEVLEAPRELAPEKREVIRNDGLRIRLSDHALVVAHLGMK